MRTKTMLITFLALVFIGTKMVSAQEQERDVSPFSAISLRVSGTVFLAQGTPQSVRVEANDETLEEIITEVKDRTLNIRFKSNNYFWKSFNMGKIEIYVTVPDIEGLSVSGSGNIESATIKSRILDLAVSGSGDILIKDLDSERVKANISGSGNIRLDGGNTEELEATVSGSGNFRAQDFEAADSDIKISGSGNCTLTAQKSLKARVSGSGSVAYKGKPQLDSTVSGSGRVKSL
jgi:hypothetical protein